MYDFFFFKTALTSFSNQHHFLADLKKKERKKITVENQIKHSLRLCSPGNGCPGAEADRKQEHRSRLRVHQ